MVFVAYIILGLVVLFSIAMVESEKFFQSFLALVSAIAVWAFFFGNLPDIHSMYQWVKANPGTLAGCVALYIMIGVAWSFVKWTSFLVAGRNAFNEWKGEFLRINNLPKDTVLNKKFFVDNNNLKYYPSVYGSHPAFRNGYMSFEKPRATQHKGRIMAWMTLWHISMIGTLIDDPLARAFKFCFNLLKSLYQKISDAIFSDMQDFN